MVFLSAALSLLLQVTLVQMLVYMCIEAEKLPLHYCTEGQDIGKLWYIQQHNSVLC